MNATAEPLWSLSPRLRHPPTSALHTAVAYNFRRAFAPERAGCSAQRLRFCSADDIVADDADCGADDDADCCDAEGDAEAEG